MDNGNIHCGPPAFHRWSAFLDLCSTGHMFSCPTKRHPILWPARKPPPRIVGSGRVPIAALGSVPKCATAARCDMGFKRRAVGTPPARSRRRKRENAAGHITSHSRHARLVGGNFTRCRRFGHFWPQNSLTLCGGMATRVRIQNPHCQNVEDQEKVAPRGSKITNIVFAIAAFFRVHLSMILYISSTHHYCILLYIIYYIFSGTQADQGTPNVNGQGEPRPPLVAAHVFPSGGGVPG